MRRYGVEFDHPGPRLRDYVRAVKACFAGFRGEPLDHHGDFYELTFLNRQWSPGPIDAPDPKVDVAAVNPWMLRMAGEVADGVHVHPLGEPGYLRRHVLPRLAAGAAQGGRDVAELSVIVPALTIVGDTDEEIAKARELARLSLSFYGSTPNYAFIWDEAGFEGTTARIREKQKAGDFAGMAAEITDDHLAVFATQARGTHSPRPHDKYGGIVDRLVLYNAADESRSGSSGTARWRGHRRRLDDLHMTDPAGRPRRSRHARRLHERFCDVDRHPFDVRRATAAFVPLLRDDRHGVVWITARRRYAVVTWGWSIEAGGAEGVLDEIYVDDRGGAWHGADRALLADCRPVAGPLFLETESHNERVRVLRRLGFAWTTRSG